MPRFAVVFRAHTRKEAGALGKLDTLRQGNYQLSSEQLRVSTVRVPNFGHERARVLH